ncbi:transcription intermediary factor 1-alpha-like [Acanthaster planci]|uniref:Transcription intermediary factor 1-alpha-like n=1 Tax=Acanthaster planci TaxID=133434 RepID=A0A8B7ZY26_ACAPL|nr:transcription intermediary factor 1-alpha-like [Acanthaster planci]
MASNVTVQSVLGKISQVHLECSICSCRFKEPKLLDCLHSFCLKCLQELRHHHDPDSTKLTCPLCRRDTQLKGNGVAALPNHFTLGALVEEFTMQEQLLEGQGLEIKCQNCEEGNKAISRCSDCDSFFCLECNKAHRRMAMLRAHEVNTLAQLQSGEISFKSKLRKQVPKCGKHPDQNVNIYCNTCEKLECTTCSLLDHAKHSLTGQMEAFDECKREIHALMAKAEQKTAEFKVATQATGKMQKTLYGMLASVNKKIDQKVDEGRDRLEQEGKTLKQEAERFYKGRVKKLEAAHSSNRTEVSHTEQKLDEMKQLMDQASCHEILDLKHKLLHNLKELTEKTPHEVPRGLTFINFESKDLLFTIGRLVQVPADENDPKPELKVQTVDPSSQVPSCLPNKCQKKAEIHKFGKYGTKFESASHVAVFSNNEGVIVDRSCNRLISFIPKSPQSPAVSKEIEIYGLYNPRCVVVTKDDKLIVVAGQIIKTFDRAYCPLIHFKSGKKAKNYPTCLAVNDNNQIAVGFSKEEEIFLHNLDGTLITRFSAPGIGDYLTSYKQRLIYTDSDMHKLTSVNYNGREVFSIGVNATGHERGKSTLEGVCCDEDGNIYVAMELVDESDEIHQFSPDGQYIGCVIKGFDHVRGIAHAPNGDLVVAEETSVVVCRHVLLS